LTEVDATDLGNAVTGLTYFHRSAAARRLRGTRCRTTEGFFDEVAAALQFPSYFGANWAALHDSLTDLSWLPADAYLIVIEDADLLLADEPDELLDQAVRELAHAADVWQGAATADPSAPGVAFHVIFQTATDGRVAQSLQAGGIGFDVIE
jgi:RNAse (barnase) inhibitor barstar